MRAWILLVSFAGAALLNAADWPAYGGSAAGIRYSALKQIDRSNVAKLQLAWSWDADEGRGDPQTQPVVVDGVVYGITPKHRVIALDGVTGKLRWRFDSGMEGRGPNRGVSYWANGEDRRIFAAVRSFVYALDAATGEPVKGFGQNSRIDLRENLGR